jgi:hypothetical protein
MLPPQWEEGEVLQVQHSAVIKKIKKHPKETALYTIIHRQHADEKDTDAFSNGDD